MKACESNSNYPSRLREMTNYTVREVKRVCKDIGPRESGEESERKAQAYVAESMKSVCDSVEVEEFDVHPKAFMSWVVIDVVLMLLSIICLLLKQFSVAEGLNTVFNIAAVALTALAVLVLTAEFLLYKQFVDPLLPKRKTCNVVCTRNAASETKRRIIFSGHIDSSYEWRFTHLGGAKLLKTMIVLGIGSIVLNLILDIAAFFNMPEVVNIIIIALACITVIPVFMCAFFINWKLVVPGANDNLTGVFASMAVIRYMQANDIRFENTEVVALSTACEESGLRGAKAFAKKHADDKIPTVFIAVDTLRDYDYMSIYNKDMSGTVKLDSQAAAMLKKASENAGLNLDYAKVFFGASDAAAAQQGGIKAAALCAMDPAPAKYYHTREDTPDNLDLKTVEAGLNVLLETAFLYDEQGLKDNY
ncbi:MAG TPA: hypothetical protein DCR23_06295 [Ruminococcaceae bacterium]|nr:hypothetical protein [Oscillospiraceae bacterium]